MAIDSRGRLAAGRRPLITFFVLAIGLGWLVALPLVFSPAGIGVLPIAVPQEWLILVACTPTLAALWTQWLATGTFRVCHLGSPVSRVVLGAAFSLLLVLLAYAIVPALVLTNGAFASLRWSAILMNSGSWWSNPLNLLGGPLNEEMGWRGFALPHLQVRYGPLRGSLLLGAMWFLWHAPLFLIHDWLSVPVWAFSILILCLAVLMTWGFNQSRGSVVSAVLMHALFNSSFPILAGLCSGIPTREPGLVWYLGGVVVTTLVALGATRGRLGYVTSGITETMLPQTSA
jgi:uncharacterized protein